MAYTPAEQSWFSILDLSGASGLLNGFLPLHCSFVTHDDQLRFHVFISDVASMQNTRKPDEMR